MRYQYGQEGIIPLLPVEDKKRKRSSKQNDNDNNNDSSAENKIKK